MTSTFTPLFPSKSVVSNTLAGWRTWHDIGKPLIHACVDTFGAENTLDLELDTVPERMLKKGKKLTQSDFVEGLTEQVFLLNLKTCIDSLFMCDAATGGGPSFRREDLNGFEGATESILMLSPEGSRTDQLLHYVASMAGLPGVIIPLGQVQYTSFITGQWEWMPMAVQIVMKRGCDGVPYELI